jgi:RNA polymerase sigma-70 factor (ECF subfamily)
VIAHQDSLYGWVLSLVKDEPLAADVTQSTLIAAYEKLDSFRGGSFRAWLYKIARNRSVDEFRHRQRHPSISLDEPAREDDDRELVSNLPGDFLLPEDAALQSEQSDLILSLFERLPDESRQVLQLVDVDGFNYEETAELLHIPLGTVKSRLTRSRLKFRKLMEESSDFNSVVQ